MFQAIASLINENFSLQASIAGSGLVPHEKKSATKPSAAQSRVAFRICMVDDNQGDIYLLAKALNRYRVRHELICYLDGEQAIRAFSREDHITPDLILLDLKMPRRDGFEVLREIRSRPSFVGVPVGILTSSEAETDRHRVELQGIDRYIHKPVDLEEFLDQVGRAVRDMLAV